MVELKAVDHMILQTLVNWKSPLDTFMRELNKALSTAMTSTLNMQVREWRTTPLFTKMMESNSYIKDLHMQNMKRHVTRALAIESVKPITRDEKLMERYVAEEIADLEAARLKRRFREHIDQQAEEGAKETFPKDWNEKAKKFAMETLEPDPYSREIGVMARIRAYYQIASMRFVDQVVQAVEAELFIKFRGLNDDLMDSLGVLDENGKLSRCDLSACLLMMVQLSKMRIFSLRMILNVKNVVLRSRSRRTAWNRLRRG